MSASDPNREQLMRVARALGDFRSEVVFVGGATLGILVSDPAAPKVRPTDDVDVVVEVLSYVDYEVSVAAKLRNLGFVVCTDPNAPICAWELDGMRLDVMPSDEKVLGFSNRWYEEVLSTANALVLDGLSLNIISPACFLATKFVAFADRGDGDYYASQDLEDIAVVIDGRPEIVADLKAASEELREYVAEAAASLLRTDAFLNALPGHVEAGRAEVVLERLAMLAVSSGHDVA
tara:strand:+ start:6064 stop:6765 length:702 start_codon:yes stop_codon:yes gene_type:complete